MPGKQKTKTIHNIELEQQKESVNASEINIDSHPDPVDSSDIEADSVNDPIKRNFPISFTKNNIIKALRILCIVGFIIFTALFINETVIQPYRTNKDINNTRDLYHKSEEESLEAPSPIPATISDDANVTAVPSPIVTLTPTPTPDPNRDEQGRLLQFKELLDKNEDVKGWITIPDTNVDYVVVQSGMDNPEFYLDKGFDKEYSKAGTLFLDQRSSVEKNSQNLVIHGHNMVSTKEKMFHNILKYKDDINYYRQHPLVQFDTIYQTGTWKIFAVFITPPDPTKDYFFEFRKSSFSNASEFLNFAYQIRIRSLINVDAVDINEDDQLLMLSTCSYEVNDDYRSIVVARKVREGEDTTVDVDSAKMNNQPYYAEDYRKKYKVKAPDVADTFEEALEKGQITWYKPSLQ